MMVTEGMLYTLLSPQIPVAPVLQRLLLEIAVVGVEGFFYAKGTAQRHPLTMSLLLNAASYGAGRLLQFLL